MRQHSVAFLLHLLLPAPVSACCVLSDVFGCCSFTPPMRITPWMQQQMLLLSSYIANAVLSGESSFFLHLVNLLLHTHTMTSMDTGLHSLLLLQRAIFNAVCTMYHLLKTFSRQFLQH